MAACRPLNSMRQHSCYLTNETGSTQSYETFADYKPLTSASISAILFYAPS